MNNKEYDRIEPREYLHIQAMGPAPQEPMTREELRAANVEYFGYIAKFVGPELAAKALDAYIDWVERSAASVERRGGGAQVGQVAIPK